MKLIFLLLLMTIIVASSLLATPARQTDLEPAE